MLIRSLIALMLAATPVAYADVANLKCTQTGPQEYRLTYDFTGSTHAVSITAGTDANHVPNSAPLLKATGKTDITLHAGKAGERMYFYLKADTGEMREVSVRHLDLEGSPNFRDLGGYQTTDGHFVRWGLVYRSGVLTYLTPKDDAYLSQLGIRVVCDFRTQKENQAAAETWIPGASTQMISLPIGSVSKNPGANASVAELIQGNPTPEQLRARMIRTYGNFAFSSADQYAAVFQQLRSEHLPLLYHCTAGKDRTGVFSALLLLTLGVPEKTVLEDYALTSQYLNESKKGAIQKMTKASGDDSLSHLSKEQLAVLIAADPAYLESTLRQIDEKYGSFDEYRRKALHVSDEGVKILRERLTQN